METILEAVELCKVYGNGTAANKFVNLTVRRGEILGLVGENGAGKSTLMKMVYGEEAPSSGSLLLDGKPVRFGSSRDAIAAGIGMVHQHFMLVPSLSLAENLVLGREPRKKSGMYDLDEAVRIAETLSAKYNLRIIPRARVVDVSVSMRQKLEILKTLYRGARILILDEPTAVLTPQETDELFAELKELRNKGQTIIFISHKLGEVFKLCDRVTVMRDGAVIATHDIGRRGPPDHLQRDGGSRGPPDRRQDSGEPRRDSPGSPQPVLRRRFRHHHGGPGVLLAADGRDPRGSRSGRQRPVGTGPDPDRIRADPDRLRAQGKVRTSPTPPRGAYARAGVAHVAEDRMTVGTALPASITDNLLADRYSEPEYTGRGGFLKRSAITEEARGIVKRFDIRCSSPNQPVASLSGGNMQKVVIGREFTADGGRPDRLTADAGRGHRRHRVHPLDHPLHEGRGQGDTPGILGPGRDPVPVGQPHRHALRPDSRVVPGRVGRHRHGAGPLHARPQDARTKPKSGRCSMSKPETRRLPTEG